MDKNESTTDLILDDDVLEVEQPERREWKNPMVSVASFFLLTDLFERFAYYSMTGSLITFFTRELGLETNLATQIQSTFQSVVYVAPLAGAYLADATLGRFKTLLYAYVLYVVGAVVMTIASIPSFNNSVLYFIGLIALFGVGSGAIKPNLIVLGGDQFDETIEKQLAQKTSYFSYFYWCTNIAAFVAFSIMGGLATQGMGAIPQDSSFFWSFAISTVALIASVGAFLLGSGRYYKPVPAGSALPTFMRVVGSGAKHTTKGKIVVISFIFELVGMLVTIVSFFISTAWVSYLAAAFIVIGVLGLVGFGRTTEWLETARDDGHADDSVDDARAVMRMMPYVAFIVIFWCVYNQMNGNFQAQGCQMNDYAMGYKWAPSQLSLFNTLGCLIFIPICDALLYPGMNKCWPATSLRRVGIGFGVCVVAMLNAGFVEMARKSATVMSGPDGVSSCSPCNLTTKPCGTGETIKYMSDISILVQIPQYFIVGVAEVFTAVTYYDLFYTEVPDSMRAVCQAINMLTTSLGTMVGGTINSVLSDWLPNDLNNGHMDLVYFVIAGLGIVNLAVFMLVSPGFVYKHESAADDESVAEDAVNKSRRASAHSLHQ
ncbi:hypothetical protein SARC_12561 [Sphaeroforma arctica JP610]|uniref:Major facilitator superfamily (MFS) profile domain-containing protein n=1 Tax=Sphaeroforma arctica JP610 TaxID=667725 RepID=A0A0L0FFR6_9EUKA|nr:hypothetical protein SARC_12561 [Sphaeroforma arctica JP610]KNC74903.1 hypothetical protein SARC_12561 [Sphaeroforma arctica JP610]|eukprot:XP_014148805.1 hypothetical protein SARC_12561 [Sphaeroforma arctica JP610]